MILLMESPNGKNNSSNTMPGAMWTQCPNKDHYSPWIRRLRRSTISDQNRSCKTTLSIPNTMISSHCPELTQNHIVFSDPSIRLSTLSAKMTKAHQRRESVTIPTMPLADRDFFFRCAVIDEREPDESHGYVQDVVAQNCPERQ